MLFRDRSGARPDEPGFGKPGSNRLYVFFHHRADRIRRDARVLPVDDALVEEDDVVGSIRLLVFNLTFEHIAHFIGCDRMRINPDIDISLFCEEFPGLFLVAVQDRVADE